MIGSLATCSLAKKFISQRGSLKLEQVTCAASLAHHGYIRTIEDLKLERLDLSSIPSDHLASLVSCVTSSVEISNVSGFDLVCFMESIRCEWLYIGIGVNMGSEETKALVRAMESHLINVRIRGSGRMTLDVNALTQYSGQGKCNHIQCYAYNKVYKEKLMTWAQRKNWKTEFINGTWTTFMYRFKD